MSKTKNSKAEGKEDSQASAPSQDKYDPPLESSFPIFKWPAIPDCPPILTLLPKFVLPAIPT